MVTLPPEKPSFELGKLNLGKKKKQRFYSAKKETKMNFKWKKEKGGIVPNSRTGTVVRNLKRSLDLRDQQGRGLPKGGPSGDLFLPGVMPSLILGSRLAQKA